MRPGRVFVVAGVAAAALAGCGGGNGSSAPVRRGGTTGDVTMTLTPVGSARPAQLAASAHVLGTRLSAVGVPAHVAAAGGVLRVSGPTGLRVAVYTAEFPEVLSFREIRVQASGSTTGTAVPTPIGTGDTGPTVTGLDAAPNEPNQTAPTPATLAQFAALDCAETDNGRPDPVDDDPHHFVVACSSDGATRYLLAPADLTGAQVASATTTQGQTSLGGQRAVWEVDLTFKDSAVPQVEAVTSRLFHQGHQQLAVTLDGVVVSAPQVDGVLGKTMSISGGTQPFSQVEAQGLAAVISSGPLPLAFTVGGAG